IRFVADDPGLAFHDLAAGRAELLSPEVTVPAYRGKRLLPVLSWLVTNQAAQSAVWRAERRIGPDFVRRELSPYGWELVASRDRRWVLLSGSVPAPHSLPPPRSFTSPRGIVFEADYGVFSPGRIDAGSALLEEVVAARLEPVDAVADIGVGYGALAISLVSGGRARRAVGTDVDSIALWLAERNAAAAGVSLSVTLDPDPLSIERTPLTVCNVPTHIDARRTAALMSGLAGRASDGRLLAVVHASLADRYARHLERPGLRVTRHPGEEHVVLEAARR
ncbi:MAG: Methyltransferase small domain, partial [Thermoleophilaceae bacterium]|nr:Methyltransferase small domain [Thermoleophilaceae bacterium]